MVWLIINFKSCHYLEVSVFSWIGIVDLYAVFYSVFHPFRQVKHAYSSSILSLNQFLLQPQWPLKTAVKVVKIDSKSSRYPDLYW